MIGICVVTHGGLAFGLKDSCELIIGEQKQLSTIGIGQGDNFDEFKETVFNAIMQVNQEQGVLVLVDLFGASPYNSVLFNYPKFKENNISVCMISGVNLAMVIEACEYRNYNDLDAVFTKVMLKGKEYIIGINKEMNQVV